MYIYLIENLINHKKYIGSTNSIERRWKEHIGASKWKSCQSYDFPLQKAIRKYGENNFHFSIIESDISSDLIAQKEQEYILKYNTLTSTGWGYNQTLYTDCALRDPEIKKAQIKLKGKRCALVDTNMNIIKIYDSLHDAYRDNFNGNDASPIRKVCLGETYSLNNKIFRFIDDNNQIIQVTNQTRKRRQNICGYSIYNIEDVIYFDSILQASQQTGASRKSLEECLNGSSRYTIVQDRVWCRIDEYGNIIEKDISVKNIIIQHSGYCSIDDDNQEIITYKSLSEIRQKEHISYYTIQKYIKNGQSYHNKKWYKLNEYGKPMKEGDLNESVDY